MDKQFCKDAFGWGFALWFSGYLLGIILFLVGQAKIIGWIIIPIGTVITLWVLFKKIKGETQSYYLNLAIVWTLIAIIFDYFFNVKIFNLENSYYKPDIYLYYALTFLLPLAAYWHKKTSVATKK